LISTAVVLAGGQGKRLRPLTYITPKPLIPVGNEPLLGHILRFLRLNGIKRVIVAVNYLGEQIKRYVEEREWGLDVQVCDRKPLDTADAVRRCKHLLPKDEPFFVVMGDVLTNMNIKEMGEFHTSSGSFATIALKAVDNPLEYGLVLLGDDGLIELFLEKPLSLEIYLMTIAYHRKRSKFFYSNLVNTGFYAFDYRILDVLEKEYFLMDFGRHVFPYLLETGHRVMGWDLGDAYWKDLGRPSSYLEAHKDLLAGRVEPLSPRGHLAEPEGVWVEEDVEVEGLVIPPVVLGRGVRIGANAVVGPYVSLGAGTRVGAGAHIKNSIVWDGVEIGAGSVLDGCIAASGAVIGREARLGPNTVVGHSSIIKDGVKVTGASIVSSNIHLVERAAKHKSLL